MSLECWYCTSTECNFSDVLLPQVSDLCNEAAVVWFEGVGRGRRVRFLVWVGQGGGFLASYFVVMYLLCYIPLFNRALMSVRFATIKYRTKIPQTRLRVCSYWPSARLAGTECMHGWKVSELLFWHLVWRNISCVSGDVSWSCYLCFSNSIIVLG